jgi:hypothetical protein
VALFRSIKQFVIIFKMYIQDPNFMPLPRKNTTHRVAWKNGKYETYRLKVEVPAVRIHSRFNASGGRWFAVDTYNVPLADYQDSIAAVRSDGAAWTFKRPHIDTYLLLPGTIINVGIAEKQGYHAGGGWQVEFVEGPLAMQIDKTVSSKRVKL